MSTTLTGLFNRAAFDTRRNELAASALRNHHKLLLFMIDLDRFKQVNDTYGHHAGDRVLQLAGARIRALSRESDVVARIGGDEVALLQFNPTSPPAGAGLASKIVAALNLPFPIDGREVYIGGSIGIAVFPDDATTPDALLKSADLALYQAKSQGRNGYHYFTDELNMIAHRRHMDQTEIRRLDRERAFWIDYQPIVEEASGRTVAMEALLRFPGPVLGDSSVEYVVELAKEIALIPSIGRWVFELVCRHLHEWRRAGITSTKIAVNTCAQELLSPNYLPGLMATLDKFGLGPADFDLELTERDAIDLERDSTQIIRLLRDMGFGIVLDDFGTGYSSLSYLRDLPVTGLKLDKSFLRSVPADATSSAISRAVIALALDLGLSVTAEGVEHEAQLEFLRNVGCSAYQGYLFAAPMSAESATSWLSAEQSSHFSPRPMAPNGPWNNQSAHAGRWPHASRQVLVFMLTSRKLDALQRIADQRGVTMGSRLDETRTFMIAHMVLFAIVLTGFARTFYLRPLFFDRTLNLTLTWHGVVLTAWFGFVALQAILALTRRRSWHVRLAWLGVPTVLGVIVTGTLVNLNVARGIESASSPENMFVWANFMSLVSFVMLVSAGVKYRRSPAAHQRLMLFASLSIIGPAFARFAFWPIVGLGLTFAPGARDCGMVVLMLIAVVYDLMYFRRVLPVTLAGLAGVITPLIAGTAVALSGIGYSLLH